MILSIIVLYYNIYSCVNCSHRFVWWNSLGGARGLSEHIPIGYVGLQFISLLATVFSMKINKYIILINVLIVIHCFLNIFYWLYIAYLSIGSIHYLYAGIQALHMFSFIYLWEEENMGVEEILDA